ncbi:MAG: hypothetical protein K2X81_07830 [Candidatus Obscuribacterales bacterium]|nr:hypothetical protein [Candidatus Obscuribacterales bacterium]
MQLKKKYQRIPGHVEIRVDHFKINVAALLFTIAVLLFAYSQSNSVNPLFLPIYYIVVVFAALVFSRLVIRCFAKGTFLMPKGPFVEALANRSDDEILASENLRLLGKGVENSVAKLKCSTGSTAFSTSANQKQVTEAIEKYFLDFGVLLKSDESSHTIKGIIGCGVRNLNPNVVTLNMVPKNNRLEVHIHAATKIGLFKQESAEEASSLLLGYLCKKFSCEELILDSQA